MKQFIHDITHFQWQDGQAAFVGRDGKVILTFLNPLCVKVEYRFEGAEIKPLAENASRWILSGASSSRTCEISDHGDFFLAETENGLSVQVEKRRALVSVLYKGQLVHGGAFRNPDLVVPAYPVRLLKDGQHLVARFNFPAEPEDEFYGLGDKGGLPNRRGRRFSMFNRDSLGYDAANSDPLYKSIPFYLKINRKAQSLCGVLFPETLIRVMDFGRESPYYMMSEVEGGPFAYCVFCGDGYREIVGGYCRVTGMPALPPLFSFGFLASSMNYVEPDDAAERVLRYFDHVEKEKIPCEGMYFSSGYLKAPDGKRYAFLWNRQKFPDHGKYLQALRKRGYNLMMNIKPGVLTTHPWYGELEKKGYFIKGNDGKPYVEYFWGGDASFIDFHNPDAKAWWKEQLKAQYIVHGCMGIWNDNNELELEDAELSAYETRSLYPVLMCQASYEAFQEQRPHKRPWIYSRAGYAGLQRYARTWTGDNTSTYQTLRYNQYMGYSLGLCGNPFYGHDLGGFFGDTPEEELMLRSCETGVLQPRFVIHSWRESGNPTEPWSYPNAFERIRSLIYAHYALMPYIYNCAIEAALTGAPIERMLRLEFPQDGNICGDETHCLFGPFVLKLSATEKNVEAVNVYLPKEEGWYDPRREALYEGGQTVSVPMPIDGRPHFLIRRGGVLPYTRRIGQLRTGYFEDVTFFLTPCAPGKTVQSEYYEDDGETEMECKAYGQYRICLSEGQVNVQKLLCGASAPAAEKERRFHLQLPQGFAFAETGTDGASFQPDAMNAGQSMTWEFRGQYQTV